MYLSSCFLGVLTTEGHKWLSLFITNLFSSYRSDVTESEEIVVENHMTKAVASVLMWNYILLYASMFTFCKCLLTRVSVDFYIPYIYLQCMRAFRLIEFTPPCTYPGFFFFFFFFWFFQFFKNGIFIIFFHFIFIV